MEPCTHEDGCYKKKKTKTGNKCWQGDVEKLEPFMHCGWECKFVQSLGKKVWRPL